MAMFDDLLPFDGGAALETLQWAYDSFKRTASNLPLVLVVPIHRVKAVDDLRAAGSPGCSA